MNTSVSVAGSRGRLAVVAVQNIERFRERKPLKRVRFAKTWDPSETPTAVASDVLDVVAYYRDLAEGAEPRLSVCYSGDGAAVLKLLREEADRGRRLRTPPGDGRYLSERPLPYTLRGAHGETFAMRLVTATALATTLLTEYQAGRVDFADDEGLGPLIDQMSTFRPVRTKAGTLVLEDEELDSYSEQVVALMGAVNFAWASARFGVPEYLDQSGNLWKSRALAVAKLGGSEGTLS